MKILIAGGVFRLSAEERARRQPAPEIVLTEGLRARGVEVDTCRLQDLSTIGRSAGYDLVHVHHLSKGAVVAALSPLARPLVFTEHATGRAGSRSHRAAQRLVLARAGAVVCLSPEEAAEKRTFYRLPNEKITIIQNGIPFAADRCRQRQLPEGGPVVLLFVGQLLPFKQVHRAIEALTELPQHVVLRLVYHNDGEEPALRAHAQALGVADRVTFVGQRRGDDLLAEYGGAHLLVLPSRPPEALPSVVTEALLTGLPVLASRVGGVPTQVREAGLLVSTSDTESLVPAIEKMIADYPAFSERAVARGHEMGVDYSIDQMIDKHLALYRRLLTRRSRT